MILKETDSKAEQLAELDALMAAPGVPPEKKLQIERELKILRAGIKGERESAYDIDFYSGTHKNRIVIHDLRLELNGRVAQIDHLVLNRLLEVYVLETKHFTEGVSINDQGEFSIWFGGKPRGIPSPLEQNDRHIAVLTEAFKTLKMPTRLGIRLQPSFESLVLVSKNARITRPEKFDTGRVLKSDQLERWVEKNIDSGSPLMMAKLVSVETLTAIAEQLVALHRPLAPNYQAKFGITEDMLRPLEVAATPVQPLTAVAEPAEAPASVTEDSTGKLTTSKLAQKMGLKTANLVERLVSLGLLELREGKPYITPKGKEAGGEFRMSKKFGPYFLWPDALKV
ncbi:MAG: nuclease-related domain-containing protein [Thauera sp.]|jgi:hypothetical protein|nr:nuclease-related domain-containing protein [Thauera sp.]